MNHMDMLAATYKDFKNPTEKTQDEMKDLLASLLEAGEFVEVADDIRQAVSALDR